MRRVFTELPDFHLWFEEFQRKEHLSGHAIARHLAGIFGGPLPTWRDRVISLRRIAREGMRKHKSDAERERCFVVEILQRTYPYVQPAQKLAKNVDTSKTVVVADPHEPYGDDAVKNEILEKHHDAEHIHINGDAADFYSKSRYPKMQGHEDFYAEIRGVFKGLEFWATHFKRVTIIRGNHDDRVRKKIVQDLNSNELWMAELDILSYMAEFFDNVKMVGTRVGNERIPIDFIWQDGDVVYTHIERSLKQNSAILNTVKEIVNDWAGLLKLKPYRFIVQGHNHRSSLEDLYSCYGMLVPMAASPAGKGLRYIYHPSMRGRPPVVGYAVLVRENGKTSFNKSRPYKIEQ